MTNTPTPSSPGLLSALYDLQSTAIFAGLSLQHTSWLMEGMDIHPDYPSLHPATSAARG